MNASLRIAPDGRRDVNSSFEGPLQKITRAGSIAKHFQGNAMPIATIFSFLTYPKKNRPAESAVSGTAITPDSSLAGTPRIDRVSARAKTPQRFLGKAQKLNTDGSRKYSDPLDQVGARVIVFYLKDVETISETVERYYTRIERKDLVPESLREFGYVGKHYILGLPEDVFDDGADRDRLPRFFELQVKTLFQHAWSEAEHDLGYKPEELQDRLKVADPRKVEQRLDAVRSDDLFD